jgi:hypothetical protein
VLAATVEPAKRAFLRLSVIARSFCHGGRELEVHYRYHPYFGRKVLVRRMEQRAAAQFLSVQGPAGIVVSIAGWMLDPDLRWNDNRRAASRSSRTRRVEVAIDRYGQPSTLPERCHIRSGGRQ